MAISNITNLELVNLQNCEDEPIHIPGSIQPHGFLVAVSKADGFIRFCSENIDIFFDIDYKRALTVHSSELFGFVFIDHLKELLKKSSLVSVSQHLGKKNVLITAHYVSDMLIIEGEQELTDEASISLYDASNQMLEYMQDSHSLRRLCELVAKGIKQITGYDRVMIYKFDEYYNGEVFAESREEYLESFLGLHYPHTDIPPQARELYLINHLRVIPDINYEPAAIFGPQNSKNNSLDLSKSVLRSVSPIHIQYLQNMGVGGTLTISLINKGKLWGLVACHHYSKKYLSAESRTTAKLQGQFIMSQIDIRTINEKNVLRDMYFAKLDKITARNYDSNMSSLDIIANTDSAWELCNADGIAICARGEIFRGGDHPSVQEIKTLIDRLSKSRRECFTDDISSMGIDYMQKLPGVGILFLSSLDNDCVIWFKKERIKQINWAGDPAKSIEKDANGLSPRKSFEKYSQIMKGKSSEWLSAEIQACQSFLTFLRQHIKTFY